MPNENDQKTTTLDSYIWKNINTNMHETQLPCILSNNFYRNKQENYQNSVILKRLNEKKPSKPSLPENGYGRYDLVSENVVANEFNYRMHQLGR